MGRRGIALLGSGIVVSGVLAYTALSHRPQPPAQAATVPLQPTIAARKRLPPPPPEPVVMHTPQRLVVPRLQINHPIRRVGLLKNGEMAVPDNLSMLGWYGAIPGNPGKAVLAAHTGFPKRPSPFRSLEQLKVGEDVSIIDDRGAKANFQIIQIERYTPEEAPRDYIFKDSATARLNIITCTGTWNESAQSYSHRLVIYSVRR